MTRAQSPEVDHLLTCPMEECAEVAQIASKGIRFGLDDIDPVRQQTNAALMRVEVNDFYAIVELLRDHNFWVGDYDSVLVAAKKKKLAAMMEYSRNRGRLKGE